MKQINIKIIIINILIIVMSLTLLNIFAYYIDCKSRFNITFKEILKAYKNFMYRDTSPKYIKELMIFNKRNNYRRIENAESSKQPIVLFGCSYTEGTGLKENETFSYKLGELTGRPIYNRAIGGWGIQHALYQLSDDDFYKQIPQPEYIIYVYFDGHLSRMNAPICYSCPPCYNVFYDRKKDKNNNIEFVSKLDNPISNFINTKLVFWGALKNNLFNPLYSNFYYFKKHTDNLFLDYLKIMKKKQEENWKNTKFVIFFHSEPREKRLIKQVKKLGFIPITREDFDIDFEAKEMQISETDPHPSAHFWNVVTPVIIEKLNLK